MNFDDDIDEQDERKDWIYLTIEDILGDSYELGKVYLSESIDSIIQKYREICAFQGCYVVLLRYRSRYINNIKTLADIGLDPNDICEGVIFNAVVRLTGGGYLEPFVDVEEAHITKLSFKKGPKYREVIRGLNFFGKCRSKICEAKNDTVYIKLGMGTFSYSELKSGGKFVCPACKNSVIPDSCGFWDCKYEIKGKGIREGEDSLRTFSKTGVAEAEHFERLDPTNSLGDKVSYKELTFIVSRREK